MSWAAEARRHRTAPRRAAPAPRPAAPSSLHSQTVADALHACDNDVDAAVRRLSELRLRPEPAAPVDERARRAASEPAAAAATAAPPSPPDAVPVEPWADALVREMAAAADVDDARARAAAVLRAHASTVLAASRGRASTSAASAQDTALLKRAVAVQAARSARDEAALGAARAELGDARARLAAAEMANYALAAHLRSAVGDGRLPPPRGPPDVF